MQKQAPNLGRLATMGLFALSCFGLLVYLWASFGGPLPLRPAGYRVQVAFPEAPQLGVEADVRIAGVPVGKVQAKRAAPGGNRTLVTLEIDDEHAPLRSDTRAMLRQKTFFGETYVELTPGSPRAPDLREGARLPDGRVREAVQLDEVFSALDEPTRKAFSTWQREFGRAVHRHGRDVNDAVGTLPVFLDTSERFLQVLERNELTIRRLVRNSGTVFDEISSDEAELRSLIADADAAFTEIGRRHDRLADTIRVLPTFLAESRLTLRRTARFAAHADPLVRELRPGLRALRPAAGDLAAAAPSLKRFALALDPLIRAARSGLPAGSQVLDELGPMFGALGPLLSELNPILEWLEYNQAQVIAVLNAPVALADTAPVPTATGREHYARLLGVGGLETAALWPQRLPINRGNAYLAPRSLTDPRRGRFMGPPSWDCNNTGRGEFVTAKGGTNDDPSCWRMGYPGWLEEPGRFPRIERADYSRRR